MVVSEDGGVTLLPLLPPAVAASEVASALEELARLAGEDRAAHPRRAEMEARDRIDRCAHVLTREQCKRVNAQIAVLDARFPQPSGYDLRPAPLRPAPGLNLTRDLLGDAEFGSS